MSPLSALVILALLAEYRGGPALSFGHPSSVLAVVSAALGITSLVVLSPWGRRATAFAGGLAAAGLFFTLPGLGWSVVAFAVVLLALGRKTLQALLFAMPSAAAIVASGAKGIAGVEEVTLFGFAFIALKAFVVVLLVEGRKERHDEGASHPRLLILVLTLGLVLLRVADVASTLSVPVEASWAESPFLVDMLKLDAHEPIYGPLDQINSYSYSPLLQLLHHALLSPFHAELSLLANRALTLLDLLAASIVFVWACAPHVEEGLARLFPSRSNMWGFALAMLACFSSLLAGSIHPDHPSLIGIAVALALVLREASFPRWLWWTALVLVTPLTVAFKLTGAGVGIGLALVMLTERRARACLALVISGLLSLATIPLFDATCGLFSKYAISMQRSHPIEWARITWAPTIHFAAATALLACVAVTLARGSDADTRVTLRRVALLFGGIGLLMLPAYLKFAGRENNLLPFIIGGVILVVVAASPHAVGSGPRHHPLLGPAVALYILMLVWTPKSAPASVSALPIAAQIHEVDEAMSDDEHLGERTLVSSTALWIRHGRRDVPVDRTNTAYELFFGHHAEAELFFQHIEDGRYRSIVVWSGDLQGSGAPAFADRLTASLRARYDRVYPPPNAPIASAVYVIYRRR